MSIKKRILAVVSVVCLLIVCMVPANDVQGATKVGTPKISNWSTYDPGVGDGFECNITWSKVKGASGYQVKVTDVWDDTAYTYMTTSTSYNTAGSSFSIKVKVRAYKKVNGKKVFGKWSASKKLEI